MNEVAQAICRVVSADAVFVDIALENVFGAAGVVLEVGGWGGCR